MRAHESSRVLHNGVQSSEVSCSAFTWGFKVELAAEDAEITDEEMPGELASEISSLTPREVAARRRAERRMIEIGDRGMTVNWRGVYVM